jgi:hypothetical protein
MITYSMMTKSQPLSNQITPVTLIQGVGTAEDRRVSALGEMPPRRR